MGRSLNNANRDDFAENKILGQLTPSGTSAVSIYSPPENIETIIKFVTIVNNVGQDKDAEFFVDNDGTTYDDSTRVALKVIPRNSEIPRSEIFVAMNNSSGNMAVKSETANALTFTVWGTERPKK